MDNSKDESLVKDLRDKSGSPIMVEEPLVTIDWPVLFNAFLAHLKGQGCVLQCAKYNLTKLYDRKYDSKEI